MLTYYYQANGKIDEGMTVAARVKTKDWQIASVILDFKESYYEIISRQCSYK